MKKTIILLLSITISQTEDFNYHLHLYSINKLSDGGVLKIPFRLADIDFIHQKDNVSVNSRVSFEYKPKFSNFYLESNSPEEFYIDLRELYMTWYSDNLEFSVGKQIHVWGSVDQNSPVDNASPYDYYYIFSMGTEQKMGSLSASINYFKGDNTFGLVFTPIHHTNRLPIGNDDFPIELPVVAPSYSILKLEDEVELSAYYKHSFDRGDISLSYFNGNDRVYNLAGAVWWDIANGAFGKVDTLFTHRKTEIAGLGATVVSDNISVRMDYGYFHTWDNTSEPVSNRQDLVDAGYQQTGINHLFKEDAYYDQVTLQLEFEAFDVNSVLGVFNYHIHSYNSDNDIPSVDTPGAELEFTDSREYFYPGLGAPLAILTDKAFMYQFQKDVGKENDLVLNMKGVNDLENDGYLYEVGFIYNLNGDIKIHSYINKVFGDNTQDDEYRFNQMEDFSHFRLELEYFF
ncbi:MAG: hypothetical protein CMG00_05830 [Candidatus Marinimicrobia bacterium]|nr:hypothetical protein [Candidatus Neomarinimicrobiota bacterium]